MTLPTDGFGIAALLVLVLPGVIFIGVRSSLTGFREADRTVPSRILQAVVVSAVLDSLYFALFAPQLTGILREPILWMSHADAWAGIVFLTLGMVVPALLAWLLYGKPPFLRFARKVWSKVRPLLTDSRFGGEPTAWDSAATQTQAGWIRVRIAPSEWVGGVFGSKSYFSTYPEPRDLFIEEQYHVDELGNFGNRVAGTHGVWLKIQDSYVVEWIDHEQKGDKDDGQ